MVVFNYSSRELTTKIVYYGPGLCGKTTNLQFIYDNMPQGVRGKMLSLATKSDRTLFFDFLPIDLGQIQGMKTKVQLYTVPGQVFYNETRRLVLKGADGVVFVADSQENMLEANLDSLRNLEENLVAHGMDPSTTPIVLQYNKRDLPNAMTLEQLNESLNRFNAPFYEAIATTGVGVQETLRHITKLVLLSLNERFGSDRRRATPNVPPQAAAPVSSENAPSVSAAALVDVPAIAPPSRAPVETPTIVAPVMPAAVAASSHASETDVDSAFGALMDDQEAELAFATPPQVDPPRASTAPAPKAATAASSRTAVASAPPRSPGGGEEWGDVLGITPDLGRGAAALADDDDVLGIGPPPAAPRAEEAEPAGTTIKIDRHDLSSMLHAEAAERAPVAKRQAPARAAATMVEVDHADALFAEPGVEPTRLVVGETQEILIPIEIAAGGAVHRYRLTVRLELKS